MGEVSAQCLPNKAGEERVTQCEVVNVCTRKRQRERVALRGFDMRLPASQTSGLWII